MKLINIWVVGFIVLISFNLDAFCQRRPRTSSASVRIDKKRPTIFLELEQIEKSDVSDAGRAIKKVRLRLTNNSKWIIKLDASGGEQSSEDASLYYDTLDENGNIKERRVCHVCSVIGLKAGKSILFDVPYDELAKAASLRVEFSYVWEDAVAVAPEAEPTHYVLFYSRKLKEKQ